MMKKRFFDIFYTRMNLYFIFPTGYKVIFEEKEFTAVQVEISRFKMSE